jgi:hypothetical protein
MRAVRGEETSPERARGAGRRETLVAGVMRTTSASTLIRVPVPTIACIDRATSVLAVDFDRLIAALQVYVDDFVAPVWGTPARLVRAQDYLKGAWALVFLDDADQEPFAFHELTPAGLPIAKVYARTSERDGFPVSLSASHELAEMLVDPSLNLMARRIGGKGTFYAYEVADPVEDDAFEIDGLAMSNFVYPAYFEHFHEPGSVKFDHLGRIREPFGLSPGGYQHVFTDGRWDKHHGSISKREREAERDRRGRRGAQRLRISNPPEEPTMATPKKTKMKTKPKAAPKAKAKAAPKAKAASKAKAKPGKKPAAPAQRAATKPAAKQAAPGRAAAAKQATPAARNEPTRLGSGGGRGKRTAKPTAQAAAASEPARFGSGGTRGGVTASPRPTDPDGGDEIG